MQDEKRKEMEEVRKTLQEFQELLKTPAWGQLVEFAQGQIENRRFRRDEPGRGLDHLVEKEFLNGEIAGIELFTKMPELIIEDFEQTLEELKGEFKDEDS